MKCVEFPLKERRYSLRSVLWYIIYGGGHFLYLRLGFGNLYAANANQDVTIRQIKIVLSIPLSYKGFVCLVYVKCYWNASNYFFYL